MSDKIKLSKKIGKLQHEEQVYKISCNAFAASGNVHMVEEYAKKSRKKAQEFWTEIAKNHPEVRSGSWTYSIVTNEVTRVG